MSARGLRLLLCLTLLLCLCACAAPAGSGGGGSAPTPGTDAAEAISGLPETQPPEVTPAPIAETAEPEVSAAPAPALPEAGEGEEVPPASGELTVNFAGELVNVPAWEESLLLRGEALPGFTVSVPREQVTLDYVKNAWRFTFETELENPAYLEVSYISGIDARGLVPSFMDSYLDFTDIEFSTAAALGRTQRSAETVVASGSSTLIKAWLLDAEGGVVAVVQSCALEQLTAQGSYFDAMLETFQLLD